MFRLFPILVLVLAACASPAEPAGRPLVAVNAQIDASPADEGRFRAEIAELAREFGGTAEQHPATIELRLPVGNWAEAFELLRRHPDASGGERVWGQNLAEQVARLTKELESASPGDTALLRSMIDFRMDRIARATIVVRVGD